MPFDSPALEAVRVYIKKVCEDGTVDHRLLCNFDQVWSLRFRPQPKCLQKDPSLKGVQRDPLAQSAMMRKIRHNLERCLDLPFTEEDPSVKQLKTTMATPAVTGGACASAMVEDWRLPRTVTTLSFADGHMGRSFITVREGQLPEGLRNKLNEDLKKFVVIDAPQSRSHVWNENTFVRYLDHLAQELGKLCGRMEEERLE